ncbi:MAG: LEA type 2 family protein [Betaproteobacteria bacterium]
MRQCYSVVKAFFNASVLKPGLLSCLLATLVLQLAACAVALKQPEIGLVSIELAGFGRVEQRFVLKLNIRNPNDIDIPLSTLDFDLEINGAQFAHGASEKAVFIPRQGEAHLEVLTVSRLAQVLAVWRDSQKQGSERMAYRMIGSVEVDGFGRIPFERRGELFVSAFGKYVPK